MGVCSLFGGRAWRTLAASAQPAASVWLFCGSAGFAACGFAHPPRPFGFRAVGGSAGLRSARLVQSWLFSARRVCLHRAEL